MMTKIEKLINSPQKVFTVSDLAIFWQMPDRQKLWSLIRHYLRKNRLKKVYSGVYVLSEDYSPLELAVNLFAPAYISHMTALGLHGINFQHQPETHLVSAISKTITVYSGHKIVSHKVKDFILFNEFGLEKENGYYLASPERAVCDTLYLEPHFKFDHLGPIDAAKLIEQAKIYQNQALVKRVVKLAARIEKGGE